MRHTHWVGSGFIVAATAFALAGCSSAKEEGGTTATKAEFLSTTCPATEPCRIDVSYPQNIGFGSLALLATGQVQLRDRVTVSGGEGTTIVSTGGPTTVGNDAQVSAISSQGDVTVQHRSSITGGVVTGGTLTIEPSSSVYGSVSQQASLGPLGSTGFTVVYPATSNGAVLLEPEQVSSIGPGRYDQLIVRSRARLTLEPGRYYVDDLQLEPDAIVEVNGTGDVLLFVSSSVAFRGTIEKEQGQRLLLGYFGTSDLTLERSFNGTVIAPQAKLVLASQAQTFAGAYFAKELEVQPNVVVQHVAAFVPAEFPPVGPGDVPPVTPPPIFTDTTCEADFDVVIDPNRDANNDGYPDIVQIISKPQAPGCPETRFCQKIEIDGQEHFIPVPSAPILDPAVPIPTGAITQGCSGELASPVCPVLGSTGQQAEGCSALPADPNCLTVTVCPDPGSWDDPNDPDVRHLFSGVDRSSLPDSLSPNLQQIPANGILSILNDLGPLYINPCEWDEVLDQFTFEVDILGSGKDAGEDCLSNAECKSRSCAPIIPPSLCAGTSIECTTDADCAHLPGAPECESSLIVGHRCTEPENPLYVNVDEGSSEWNIRFDGGLAQGKASIRRAVFFPSTEFDVAVEANAHLRTTAMGHEFNLFRLDILSELSECGYHFDWSSRSGDDDIQFIDGLIRENLGVGAYIPGNVAAIQAQSPAAATQLCEQRLAALHQAERKVNEDFHDALIASTFYNLAGPNGSVVTSQAAAQAFIDTYVASAAAYETALAEYRDAQQDALDHAVAGRVADFQVHLDVAFVKSYPIGIFTPVLEIGLYGRAGIADVELENTANTRFTNSPETPCAGDECLEIGAQASATPRAAVGVFAFIGGGVNFVIAGGRIGIRGELDLVNMRLPLTAEFALQRTTLPATALLDTSPLIPSALGSLISGPADLLVSNAFEVTPVMGQYTAPYAIGAELGAPGGVDLKAEFLSGRISLWAKAWFLFWTAKWEKTLVSWKGRELSWRVGEPITGDGIEGAGSEIRDLLGMVAAPNLVLLPKLALLPVPGFLDPTLASEQINEAFDTQVTENNGIRFNAHQESDLAAPWKPHTEGGRCDVFDPDIK